MPKTYAALQKQIAKLQKEAAQLRHQEIASVVARIREAMSTYGLTVDDLRFGRTEVASQTTKISAGSGFSDGNGQTWSGRGPRPQWFKDALAAGKNPNDLRTRSSARTPKSGLAAKKKLKAGTMKYRDGQGNSWSGHGRRPQWFLDALATGKSAKQLTVK